MKLGVRQFSVNVNTVDVVMLKEALSKAIEEENYEQASRLRDEIKTTGNKRRRIQ